MVRKLKKSKESKIKVSLVKMKENDFILNFGESTAILFERFYKALDSLESNNRLEAQNIFKSIVDSTVGHFDSLLELINIYTEKKDLPNIAKSYKKGWEDTKYIFSILPSTNKLPWSYSSNKSFLKFLYNLANRYFELGKYSKSKDLLIKLRSLDGGNKQNEISLLNKCFFELNESDQIIENNLSIDQECSNEKFSAIINLFEASLKDEGLKSSTINTHLGNLDLFSKEFEDVNKVINKIEKEIKSFNKTSFTRTITSLNKFYTFYIDDEELIKEAKIKLKEIKDKYLQNF